MEYYKITQEIKNNAFLETLENDVLKGTIQYEFINDKYKLNPSIALKALEYNNNNINYIPKELMNDSEFVLKTITLNHKNIVFSSYEFKNSIEDMKKAILINGKCFEYGTPFIRNNKELCVLAMNNVPAKGNNNPLFFTSPELKTDKELVKLCVSQGNFTILQQTLPDYLLDKEIALCAVKKDGMALKYFKKEIKMDKDVCLEAVKNDSKAYYYINKKQKFNKEVILETIKKDESLFPYIYKRYKNKFGNDISDFILSLDEQVKLDRLEIDRINEKANKQPKIK